MNLIIIFVYWRKEHVTTVGLTRRHLNV